MLAGLLAGGADPLEEALLEATRERRWDVAAGITRLLEARLLEDAGVPRIGDAKRRRR